MHFLSDFFFLILMMIEAVSSAPYNISKMVAYADDFTTGGKIKDLNHWWETLCQLEPRFGCYLESSKSWLIVKKELYENARTMFKDT